MKRSRRSKPFFLAAGVATASAVAGCGGNPSAGEMGHINMDAVKEAFEKNPSVEDFEKRVNEIFEGDGLVIFNANKVEGGFQYGAYEDLDKDKQITSSDDRLFTITVANGTATLKGAGVNSYYSESWPYEPKEEEIAAAKKEEENGGSTGTTHRRHGSSFFMWYALGRWSGGYHTPASSYSAMSANRASYRGSSAYASQVKTNSAYQTSAAKRYGAGFRSASSQVSSSRTSRISSTRSSGVRSSGGGSFRGSSGFGV